jgi:hypothetical protein
VVEYLVKKAEFECGRKNNLCPGCNAQLFTDLILWELDDEKARTGSDLTFELGGVANGYFLNELETSIKTTNNGADNRKIVFHNEIQFKGKPCKENNAEVLVSAEAV